MHTPEKWTYFETRWARYKRLSQLPARDVPGQLLECCTEELLLDLHRNKGNQLDTLAEDELLQEIRRLAVREENTLVSRVVLRGMTQDRDEAIRTFAARVRGQAAVCKYTILCHRAGCDTQVNYSEAEVKDQICKGLADLDIQQDLLGDANQQMTLEEVIKFVEAKEAGKGKVMEPMEPGNRKPGNQETRETEMREMEGDSKLDCDDG